MYKLVFNTIDWINEETAWSGGTITDNESKLNEMFYTLSNNGSANYVVDNVNPSDTEFIIYVKEGDVIKFEAATTVTSNHPFKIFHNGTFVKSNLNTDTIINSNGMGMDKFCQTFRSKY